MCVWTASKRKQKCTVHGGPQAKTFVFLVKIKKHIFDLHVDLIKLEDIRARLTELKRSSLATTSTSHIFGP